MAEASAAVERRKASASRWTRGRARRAFGWRHPMRGVAPRDSCAFSALRLPLFFWRQKTSGFGRQNPDADGVAGTRILSAPAKAGEGDHWSSRSERTVVEGAQDAALRCRCRKSLCTRDERTCLEITKDSCGALSPAPPPPPCFAGWSPSPAIAVADGDRHAAAKVPRHFNRFFFQYAVARPARFPRHDFTLRASPNGRSEAGFGRDNAAVVEGSHGVT
jgi:hypothetical protein